MNCEIAGSKSGHSIICWFCKKGRHDQCMKEIPTAAATDGGPHDCTFDTAMVKCQCMHHTA